MAMVGMGDPSDPGFPGRSAVTPLRISTPEQLSRVDTLTEDFARLLGQARIDVGSVIGGRYKLLERLGKGGMGEVYLAENLAIGLKVAVKLLQPDLLQKVDFRRRFQREAEAIAAVVHPNVARFLDLVVGDPTFIVMEHVPGPTLGTLLRAEGKLPVERALKIAIGICRGLKAVHAARVVHRDLKPSNVIVTADADYGETGKIIDFGLAKVAQAAEEETLTRKGTIVGTPAYMAPEQIVGDSIDAPADIYSLGCLLFHMLAGSPPFSGEDVTVLTGQLHREPPPLASLRAEVSPELAGLVEQTLRKNPLERHADMEHLQRALVSVLPPASSTRSDDELTTGTRGKKLTVPASEDDAPGARRKHPWAVVGLVAGAVIAVGFIVGFAAARIGKSQSRPSASAATLIVLSHPVHAHVEIDGRRFAEDAPAVATGLAAGSHQVRFSQEGYEPLEQPVLLEPGERRVVEVSLPPAQRKIELRSSPPGAEVRLDGRTLGGTTPLSLSVTADDFHAIHLERAGYEPVDYALKPEMHDPVISLDLDPERKPRGLLVVTAPISAEVLIDDVPSAQWTPLDIRLPLGVHRIQLRDEAQQLRGAPKTVTVQQGEIARVAFDRMEEPVGR
jgi:serine/threonine-protein kinase